jgi:hypothetical protein
LALLITLPKRHNCRRKENVIPGSTEVASNDDLENRVRRLEMTVQSLLQTQLRNKQTGDALPWWERIAGTFRGDEDYREAMSIAASIRRDQKPEDESL